MSCNHKGRRVKAGMLCVWVAGKTMWSSCYTWAVSEHFTFTLRAMKRQRYCLMSLITGWSFMCFVVLGWIESFLINRMQQVSFSGQLASKQSLPIGILQGFIPVLGPLLYLLYTAELEQLILRHGLHIYQYANDSQVYTACQSAMYW